MFDKGYNGHQADKLIIRNCAQNLDKIPLLLRQENAHRILDGN